MEVIGGGLSGERNGACVAPTLIVDEGKGAGEEEEACDGRGVSFKPIASVLDGATMGVGSEDTVLCDGEWAFYA